jgi:hypothetical protein
LVFKISYSGNFCLSAYAIYEATGNDSDLYLGCLDYIPGPWKLAFLQVFKKALVLVDYWPNENRFFTNFTESKARRSGEMSFRVGFSFGKTSVLNRLYFFASYVKLGSSRVSIIPYQFKKYKKNPRWNSAGDFFI